MQTILRTAGVAAMAALIGSLTAVVGSQAAGPRKAARFTADGKLEYPADYRSWVFLSAGMDMAYGEVRAANPNVHLFDNVFVDRVSHDAFMKTGRWPEGAIFALEIRRGTGQGSINKAGQFQTDKLALEIHVKDKRYPSGWAFFTFRDEKPSGPIPQTSACNTCHQDHGAVDTTFVQFYPTLTPVAAARKTFSEKYLAEEAQKLAVK
jgi:hypothetical protein